MPRNNNNRNNNQRPKRVRIDETQEGTNPSNTKSDKVSPTEKAKLELERRIASRPMDMQSHLKSLGLEILNLRRDHFNKKNIVKRMQEDTDYIPKSARNKFTLTFSEDTKARAPQRILELNTQAQAAVTAYQAAIKATIIAANQEESITIQEKLKDAICKSLYQVSKTHSASLGKDCDPHLVVSNLFAHGNLQSILESSPFNNKNELVAKYKTVHQQQNLPRAITYPPNPRDNATPEERGDILTAQQQAMQQPSMQALSDLLDKLQTVIIHPWEAFIRQTDENSRLLAVKKISTELIENKATDATAMLVDQEAPINAQQMTDIINQAVKKATQSLQQQINQLQATKSQSSNSKNSRRGSSRQRSASPKKKSTTGNNKGKAKGKPKPKPNSNRGRSRSRSNGPRSDSSWQSVSSNRPRRGKPRKDASVDDDGSASSRSRSKKPARRRNNNSRKKSTRNRSTSRRRTTRS